MIATISFGVHFSANFCDGRIKTRRNFFDPGRFESVLEFIHCNPGRVCKEFLHISRKVSISVLGSAYLLPPVARFAVPLTYLVAPADTLKEVARSTERFSIGNAFDKLAENANSAAASAADSVKGLTDESRMYSLCSVYFLTSYLRSSISYYIDECNCSRKRCS